MRRKNNSFRLDNDCNAMRKSALEIWPLNDRVLHTSKACLFTNVSYNITAHRKYEIELKFNE